MAWHSGTWTNSDGKKMICYFDGLAQDCGDSNANALESFSPPAWESTIEYRTSPLRQARMKPKLKAAPVYI